MKHTTEDEMRSEQPSAPPRRPRFRWLKRVAIGTVVLLVAGFAGNFLYQHSGEQVLERTIAELDRSDRDWRIEHIEANRREIPNEQNSALIVLKIYGLESGPQALLPRGWETAVVDKFERLEPKFQLNEAQVTLLRTELQKLTPALTEARKLADLPAGRYPITYSRDGFSTLLPHVQGNRSVTNLLIYDARLRAQEGQIDEALQSLRAAVNGGRSLADEPTWVSQLTRIACVSVATNELERVLAQGEPSPQALAAVQKLLEAEDENNALLVGARGDRALSHRLLKAIDDRTVTPRQFQMLVGNRSGPITGVTMVDDLIETWRPNALPGPRDHAALLRYYAQMIEIAKLPVEQRVPRLKELEATLVDQSAATRALLPASFKIAEADTRRLAGLRTALAALAAERYRLATGRWPDSLTALVPEYLAAIPPDPFDGTPLRMARLADGLMIYSVGLDRTDDGGKVVRNAGPRPGTDLGFRLWDPAKRRQAAPLPSENVEGQP